MSRENKLTLKSRVCQPVFQSAPGSMSRENGCRLPQLKSVTRSFQSAPGSMSRENGMPRMANSCASVFQSAPGSMSRENAAEKEAERVRNLFQSAPGSMSRENRPAIRHPQADRCFNPLPAR